MLKFINDELNVREWSQRELARRANVSHTLVSNVLSSKMPPSWDFCAGVAKAFGKRPEDIFILAGLLPPTFGKLPELSEEEFKLVLAYRRMSPEARKNAVEIVLLLAHQDEQLEKTISR